MNSAAILRHNQPLWGEWSIGSVIGSGAQSHVFLVTNDKGEKCALKVMPLEGDEEQQDALREQLELTRRMGKVQGFMPCLEIGEFTCGQESVVAVLMPLLTPLSEIMMEREEDLSVCEILTIGSDLSAALNECRRNGIIHRDIKPANVFADDKGHYCLGDLGVARNLEQTLLATRKGTPAYMSPEIASGRPCSHSSDVYSLGVMIYQLLNGGRLPLLEKEARYTEIENAVARRLEGEELPLPQNAPNRLGQLVCDMCAFDRRKRPEALRCAARFGEFSSLLAQGKEIPQPLPRLNRQKRKLLVLSGAAVLVLVVLLVVLTVPKAKQTVWLQASSPAVNAFSSGGFAGDGQWLYFGSDVNGTAAFRVNRDTGEKQTIYDGSVTHLNLCGERLYFTANHTIDSVERLEDGSMIVYMRGGVRSMNPDGSDERPLCLCDTLCAVEYGGWIYHYLTEKEYIDEASQDGGETAVTRVMRVRNDGSAEEQVCRLDGIYTTGMYVYRDRIYLVCGDYSLSGKKDPCVLSVSTDGKDVFRVIDGDAAAVDFFGDSICFTTDRLNASPVLSRSLDGTGEGKPLCSGLQAECFCIYGNSIIYYTGVNYFGSADEDYGLFVRDISGGASRRLLDASQTVNRMQIADDMLLVETKDQQILLIDIADGQIIAMDDFRYEFY